MHGTDYRSFETAEEEKLFPRAPLSRKRPPTVDVRWISEIGVPRHSVRGDCEINVSAGGEV